VKEIGGHLCKNLDFLLHEPPEKTANDLNKHQASIGETFLSLSENPLIPETLRQNQKNFTKANNRKNTQTGKK